MVSGMNWRTRQAKTEEGLQRHQVIKQKKKKKNWREKTMKQRRENLFFSEVANMAMSEEFLLAARDLGRAGGNSGVETRGAEVVAVVDALPGAL